MKSPRKKAVPIAEDKIQLSTETLNKIYLPIAPGLTQVKKELKHQFTDIGEELVYGKCLRPALCLFASHAFEDTDHSASVILATALELIHNASLIHDDIMDDTAMRRTGQALHIPIGLRKALLFGDYLFANALKLIKELGKPVILATIVDTVKTMCEGQWIEINLKSGQKLSHDQYLEIISKKTASLFASSCKTGALLRGADEEEVTAFYQFGFQFGIVYQVLDDLNDLKNQPRDLIILRLLDLGGVDYCYALAREHINKTESALSSITNPIVQNGYNSLVNYLKQSCQD